MQPETKQNIPASPWIRMLAFAIDFFPILIIISIVVVTGTEVPGVDMQGGDQSEGMLLVLWVILLVAHILYLPYYLICWIWKGATFGLWMTSSRIVDAGTLGRIGLGQAVRRYIGLLASILTFGLGGALSLFNRRRRGLQDMFGNTIVIRQSRGPTGIPLFESDPDRPERLRQGGTYLERGRPFFLVDFLGSILSIFTKILLWNRKIGNRNISPETEAVIRDFTRRHRLTGVTVRLNQYSPRDQFECLEANKRMSGLIRCMYGVSEYIGYTFSPWRLFGSDLYSPTSNTVHLFSDLRSVALHEMGHALDFSRRAWPGIYALLRFIPILALYQEYKATRYAIAYFKETGDAEGECEAYRILIPAYGTYIAGLLIPLQFRMILFFPFVILGHFVGRSLASRVKQKKTGA